MKDLAIVKETTKIKAGNDVINALYGSLGGEDGIIIIAGTGSVSFGKNKDKIARAGGYCYQEGDAGSSYDLGYKALQHLARVIDNRYEETSFSLAHLFQMYCNIILSYLNGFVKKKLPVLEDGQIF